MLNHRHTQRAATIAINERVDIDTERVDDVDTNIERVNAITITIDIDTDTDIDIDIDIDIDERVEHHIRHIQPVDIPTVRVHDTTLEPTTDTADGARAPAIATVHDGLRTTRVDPRTCGPQVALGLDDQLAVDAVCFRLASAIERAAAGSCELRDRICGAEWSLGWATRNRIAQGYAIIDFDVIRATVERDLPHFEKRLHFEINAA